MIRCEREGCTAEALWAPEICVPAKGHPRDTHQPVAMTVGLRLCAAHVAEVKADQFLGSEVSAIPGNLRRAIELMTMGRAPPDFDRAFVRRVSIDSPAFLALQAARPGPGQA